MFPVNFSSFFKVITKCPPNHFCVFPFHDFLVFCFLKVHLRIYREFIENFPPSISVNHKMFIWPLLCNVTLDLLKAFRESIVNFLGIFRKFSDFFHLITKYRLECYCIFYPSFFTFSREFSRNFPRHRKVPEKGILYGKGKTIGMFHVLHHLRPSFTWTQHTSRILDKLNLVTPNGVHCTQQSFIKMEYYLINLTDKQKCHKNHNTNYYSLQSPHISIIELTRKLVLFMFMHERIDFSWKFHYVLFMEYPYSADLLISPCWRVSRVFYMCCMYGRPVLGFENVIAVCRRKIDTSGIYIICNFLRLKLILNFAYFNSISPCLAWCIPRFLPYHSDISASCRLRHILYASTLPFQFDICTIVLYFNTPCTTHAAQREAICCETRPGLLSICMAKQNRIGWEDEPIKN